jgi:hypothetical protein
MESREAWDAELWKELVGIAESVAALYRTVATNQTDPPASSHGPHVDALARKAVCFAILAEVARVAARMVAWKARWDAGYPHKSSAAQVSSDPRGMI